MSSPILAFGMPRSGTTWIGKILDSHTDTLYRHEPDSWRRLSDMPLFPPMEDVPRYENAIREYVDALPALRVTKTCGKLPVFYKSYYSKPRRQLLRGSLLVARVAERAYRGFPVIGAPSSIDAHNGIRLVWKSIESLGRLGLFTRGLPDAQAVHILRHPCGYIASVLRGEADHMFTDNSAASEDYGLLSLLLDTDQARRRGLDIDALRAMEPVERLAWRWVLCNEKSMDDHQDCARYRLLRYEDMCIDTERVARDLFAWLGLDWVEQTSAFIARSTETDWAAYYSVYKNSGRSALKWKDELDSKSIELVRQVVKDSAPARLYDDLGW